MTTNSKRPFYDSLPQNLKDFLDNEAEYQPLDDETEVIFVGESDDDPDEDEDVPESE